MLGKHNVLNAAAAAILCIYEGISIEIIQDSLLKFEGIDRRMQIFGERRVNNNHCIYIDDYGHHPTEIEKTIEAIRESFSGYKINMVFQPHRFTRTHDLFDKFIDVLGAVDQLLLLEIYSAGEKAIEGVDSSNIKKSLLNSGFNNVELFSNNDSIIKELDQNIDSDTVFVFQGAGNISSISSAIKKEVS
jgi:UDP-N-acetylmuramate--alanine ligase